MSRRHWNEWHELHGATRLSAVWVWRVRERGRKGGRSMLEIINVRHILLVNSARWTQTQKSDSGGGMKEKTYTKIGKIYSFCLYYHTSLYITLHYITFNMSDLIYFTFNYSYLSPFATWSQRPWQPRRPYGPLARSRTAVANHTRWAFAYWDLCGLGGSNAW